jgi:hypothetical protein
MIPNEGGAGRRPAKGAAAPMDQSREAHHPARPLHSPEGAAGGWGRVNWVGLVGFLPVGECRSKGLGVAARPSGQPIACRLARSA